jgi:xanthine dehydrogenase accessory factor
MSIYDELKQNISDETLCAVVTIVTGANIGAKIIAYTNGHTSGDLGNAALQSQVVRDAQRAMQIEQSENRAYGDAEIFIEVFAPKPKLVIFGGVQTAIPLTQYAQSLGFHVTIIDGRAHFATRERFPTADQIIVEWPEEALAKIKMNSATYVAILTHDPKFDIPALAALSQITPVPRYIGSMGSRETRKQHFAELRAMGVSEKFLARVHGPIGLDLGGHTPEEMALAIIAEVVAVRYGRRGGFLKEESKNPRL